MSLIEIPEIEFTDSLLYTPPPAITPVTKILLFTFDEDWLYNIDEELILLNERLLTNAVPSALELDEIDYDAYLSEEEVQKRILDYMPHYILLNVSFPRDYETVVALMHYAEDWVQEGRLIVSSTTLPSLECGDLPLPWLPGPKDVVSFLEFMITPEEVIG